jgi:hypothetical protein
MGMLTDIMNEQIDRREGTILDRFVSVPKRHPGPKIEPKQYRQHQPGDELRYAMPVGHPTKAGKDTSV